MEVSWLVWVPPARVDRWLWRLVSASRRLEPLHPASLLLWTIRSSELEAEPVLAPVLRCVQKLGYNQVSPQHFAGSFSFCVEQRSSVDPSYSGSTPCDLPVHPHP